MMTISLYSFLMATLWFTAFILLGAHLQRKAGFLFCYQLTPLLLLVGLTVFRLAVPVEVPFTQVVCSTALYPVVQDFLQAPLFKLSGTVFSVTHALLGLWGLVALLLCIRLLFQIRRDMHFLSSLSALPCDHIRHCLNELLSRRGYPGHARLIVSPDISAPMVTGLFWPVILLPPECAELSESELECILNHELTHLHSGDLWVKLILRLLCCLMWWNPCIYLLQKNLDSALEYKCDLAVTKGMSEFEKVLYLQTLLNVLKLLVSGPLPQPQALKAGFCGIAETVELKRRFELVLDRPDRNKRPAAIVFMVAIVILFVASYSVILQPASKPPVEDLTKQVLITPETTYILKTTDGTYYLVFEDGTLGKISSERLQQEPLRSLPIKKESAGN